jgi:hypothetical protein
MCHHWKVTRGTLVQVPRGPTIRWHVEGMDAYHADKWQGTVVDWEKYLDQSRVDKWHILLQIKRCHVAQTWATMWHPVVGLFGI